MEWFGYLLLPDTRLQRFLLMVGDGSNGKSVVFAAIEALLGILNISSVPLEMFADKFRLAGTLGKLVNLIPEIGELDKIAEGYLKAFVVGDAMEFERKFKQPFTARPTARLVAATNNPPRFSDKSDGVWRRISMLHFTVQIPKEEVVPGMDKPEFWREETPGILNCALAGRPGYAPRELHPAGRAPRPWRSSGSTPTRHGVSSSKATSRVRPRRNTSSVRSCTSLTEGGCTHRGHYPLADNAFGNEVVRVFRSVVKGDGRWEACLVLLRDQAQGRFGGVGPMCTGCTGCIGSS